MATKVSAKTEKEAQIAFEDLAPATEYNTEVKAYGLDFPPGTMLTLDTKKYLWAVMGHIGLEVPVSSWDELSDLIDAWMSLQGDWEEDLKEDLDDIYRRIEQSPGAKKSYRTTDDDAGKAKNMRGMAINLGKQKGIYIIGKYPNFSTMGVGELGKMLDYLKALPDKGAAVEKANDEPADAAATSRIRTAHLSRR